MPHNEAEACGVVSPRLLELAVRSIFGTVHVNPLRCHESWLIAYARFAYPLACHTGALQSQDLVPLETSTNIQIDRGYAVQ